MAIPPKRCIIANHKYINKLGRHKRKPMMMDTLQNINTCTSKKNIDAMSHCTNIYAISHVHKICAAQYVPKKVINEIIAVLLNVISNICKIKTLAIDVWCCIKYIVKKLV